MKLGLAFRRGCWPAGIRPRRCLREDTTSEPTAHIGESMRRRDLWYKNAIIYCLDVETFQDGSGDGIGDFAGLINRLDKLAGIGITCIWLNPFYPTPNRDNGYDVTDYYGVDPRLGTLGDFVE